jgi:DNA/RNA-binding domain of Phe-tRNA-synthetase-like protein
MPPNFTVSITRAWRLAYPGALIGLLALEGINNVPEHPEMERQNASIEEQLRLRFARMDRKDLLKLPVFSAYREYYKRFDKTYHVLLQLESVVFKGNPLPRRSTLVDAMFAVELKNQLLTAVHDLDRVSTPLSVDIADGSEVYQDLRGETRRCKRGDMIMRDAEGVICSVIYGSDHNTKITSATANALFVVYAPPGIEPSSIEEHLKDIEEIVQLFSPKVEVNYRRVLIAEEST